VDLGLQDKVALITGSGAGIGRTVAMSIALRACPSLLSLVRRRSDSRCETKY
jgi:NAD(P)-dependent dehydrogenase (short-subunit alcohol dehydrogenase family)